jgi:hypothetical protein
MLVIRRPDIHRSSTKACPFRLKLRKTGMRLMIESAIRQPAARMGLEWPRNLPNPNHWRASLRSRSRLVKRLIGPRSTPIHPDIALCGSDEIVINHRNLLNRALGFDLVTFQTVATLY